MHFITNSKKKKRREPIDIDAQPCLFVPENPKMIRASLNPTMPLQPSFFSPKAARLSTTLLFTRWTLSCDCPLPA